MPYLVSSKLSSTATGQQELLDITTEQLELDQDFDPLDKESNSANRLITCIKYVIPIFSVGFPFCDKSAVFLISSFQSKRESTRFVTYICDQVLPHWDLVATLEQGELLQLAILRQLAELSIHCGKLENPLAHVAQIFEKLKVSSY